MWAMCSTSHVLLFTFIDQWRCCRVLPRVIRSTSGVVLSTMLWGDNWFLIGSCPIHGRVSHRVFPDDINPCSDPSGQGAPPLTPTSSDHYLAHPPLYHMYGWRPHLPCAFVYIRLPTATKAWNFRELAISSWELSSPRKGFPTGFPGWHQFLFRSPQPRCPTLDAGPLRPLLGPRVIVPYIRGRIARMLHTHAHTNSAFVLWYSSLVKRCTVTSHGCKLTLLLTLLWHSHSYFNILNWTQYVESILLLKFHHLTHCPSLWSLLWI